MRTLDIEDRYLKIVQDILRDNLHNEGQVSVYAFGSRATGQARKFSDLDLALDIRGEKSENLIWRLKSEFEESDLPFKVDVINLSNVTPTFYNAIQKDLLKLYEVV